MICDARKGSAVLAAVLALGLALPAAAGALAPGVGASFASGDPLVTEVKAKFKGKTVHVNKTVKVNKTIKVNKNVYVTKNIVVRPYKAWVRKSYYGNVIAGVALGTIFAVSAIPPAPAPDLCWYWANQAHTRGYWDYCY